MSDKSNSEKYLCLEEKDLESFSPKCRVEIATYRGKKLLDKYDKYLDEAARDKFLDEKALVLDKDEQLELEKELKKLEPKGGTKKSRRKVKKSRRKSKRKAKKSKRNAKRKAQKKTKRYR